MQLTHNYKTASLVQQKKIASSWCKKTNRAHFYQSCRAANNSLSSNTVQLKLAHVRRNLRANSGLNFYLDFFFFFNKAFSQKHFFYSFLRMQSSVCRQKEFNWIFHVSYTFQTWIQISLFPFAILTQVWTAKIYPEQNPLSKCVGTKYHYCIMAAITVTTVYLQISHPPWTIFVKEV